MHKHNSAQVPHRKEMENRKEVQKENRKEVENSKEMENRMENRKEDCVSWDSGAGVQMILFAENVLRDSRISVHPACGRGGSEGLRVRGAGRGEINRNQGGRRRSARRIFRHVESLAGEIRTEAGEIRTFGAGRGRFARRILRRDVERKIRERSARRIED